jgi:hypothetical protein
VEGSGHAIYRSIIPKSACWARENPRKPSVRIARLRVEIWTRDLMITCDKLYGLSRSDHGLSLYCDSIIHMYSPDSRTSIHTNFRWRSLRINEDTARKEICVYYYTCSDVKNIWKPVFSKCGPQIPGGTRDYFCRSIQLVLNIFNIVMRLWL